MYLRFRSSQLTNQQNEGTFEELYQQIHGRLPKQSRLELTVFFKVQIYLVKSEWVNGKPKQIYIGALANAKIYIDENKKVFLTNEVYGEIAKRLNSFGITTDKQKQLINKIELYLAAKNIIH